MIKIQKTINKTLVPMDFIKGLEILCTFVVVAGMVSIVESQAIALYYIFPQHNYASGFTSLITGILGGGG